MKKDEIFNIIIEEVCDVCNIREESIYSTTKLQMVVDARILAVQYLRRTGFSNEEIALLVERIKTGDDTFNPTAAFLKQRGKGMQRLFDSYSQRCLESYAFCLMSHEIKQFCRERYSEMYLSWMKALPSE